MRTEFEATFINVDKDQIREKLLYAGAVLVYPERLQRRSNFYLPDKNEFSWVRVRDEGGGLITLSYKNVPDKANNINEQKELCLKVDDFELAKEFLLAAGCFEKSFQETRREAWQLGGADITIDEWPFLNPFVEIEAESEEIVKAVSELIGFDYNQALFCNVFYVYSQQYGISVEELKRRVENDLNQLTFDPSIKNPFIIQ